MKKRFLASLLLILIIFLAFIALRESGKKYNIRNYNTLKKYNFIK